VLALVSVIGYYKALSSLSYAGQVGYAMMNMRNTSEAQIGDTFYHEKLPVEPLPGFKPATPMVSL